MNIYKITQIRVETNVNIKNIDSNENISKRMNEYEIA